MERVNSKQMIWHLLLEAMRILNLKYHNSTVDHLLLIAIKRTRRAPNFMRCLSHTSNAITQRDAIFLFSKVNKTVKGKKFFKICRPNSLNC